MTRFKLSSRYLLAALTLGIFGFLAGCDKDKDIEPPAELVDFKSSLDVERVWSVSIGGGDPVMRAGLAPAVDGEVVLAYVSGANQLDEKKLALAAGGLKCTRVDADVVRQATGFPIGGVPPFGHSTQLRVFVDPDLLQYDEVWAAAGTWNDNFGAAPADIVRVAGGVVTDLKRG